MAIQRVLQTQVINDTSSILDPARPGHPANLRIRFPVYLRPVDPWHPERPSHHLRREHVATGQSPVRYGHAKDADDVEFKIRSLTTAEYNQANKLLKRRVEMVFNNQIILLPPDETVHGWGISDDDYKSFISDPNKPAHCKGSLDVVTLGRTAHTHHKIDIVMLERPIDQYKFRSWSERLQTGDLGFTYSGYVGLKGEVFHDIVAAHEIGHWIVGDHINAANVEDPNSDEAYGTTVHDRRSIMGAGNIVTAYDARPWINRVKQHTGTRFGWRFMPQAQFDRSAIPISEQQRRILGRGRSHLN